ncbi:MAG TPA: choice-of-anchor Q domain-containing protein [Solirubrobacterales bacterium]|nr:choice-of-anchor Q domain-containing protein [Solirubrobacterales bacterium]
MTAAALTPVAGAAADPFPVTNTNDAGPGSLRAAIVAANGRAGEDTIPISATGTIDLETPLQVIFDNVSILGPGASQLEVRRAAGAADFSVFAFSTDAGPSSLTGLTVSNGRAALSGGFAVGGGIRNSEGGLTLTGVVVKGNEAAVEGGTKATAEGGGIYSEGPLTLRETVVSGNAARASNGSSETWALGGGVAALGTLTVEASTISGNVSEVTGGGTRAVAQGGGLVAGVGVAIERSTISGNTVKAAGAASQVRSQGGGVQMNDGTLTSSTVSGNSAISADEARSANLHAGGIGSDSILARNTIVADPLGDANSCDVGGLSTLSSGGYNLDEDGSCGFGQGSDLTGVDPMLGPLADNGGPTATHALLAGSVAIDRGNSFGAVVDQRGLPRPVDFTAISNAEGGDGSDVGAFELQPPPAPAGGTIVARPVAGDRAPPNTRIVFAPARVTFERLAKFRFASSEPQSRFQCKVDKGKWRGCRNPFKRKVSAGRKHLFKVRAIDRFGNVDPTPARFGWRVKRVGG